ncbi:MAG: hypothetical protein ACK4TC_09985 [Sphingomonas pseudosanguinis]|uniref:hypothetical protein n=1 Tax=Sphingomonas pseudosanguinis TaxID=413712 RepID=UPI00391C19A8
MATKDYGETQFLYSPAVRVSQGATFGLGSNLAWDAYLRSLCNQRNAAFTRLANELLRRGLITESETRALVDQRNRLVLETRKPLSPFGKVYSEILKPRHDLPTYEKLIRRKGTDQAILQSIGKTRSYVNRLSLSMRYAGHGMVVLNLTLAVVLITQAKPEDRARVAIRQGGALAGGAAGGWSGAWAGCVGLGTIASPSLAIPYVGEIGTGGACLVGGILGGLGVGAAGAWFGDHAGTATYDYITRLEWL